MAAKVRILRKRYEIFLAARPWCEFPLGCGRPSTAVHHRRGRVGHLLLDERWWAASCHFHNDYAETRTGHSREIGWLLSMHATPIGATGRPERETSEGAE